MNERIQELLTPKLKEWGGASGDNFSEELEKFAELIIKECASHLNWVGDDAAGIELLEHFGVEQ
jgi:hypothetical protein